MIYIEMTEEQFGYNGETEDELETMTQAIEDYLNANHPEFKWHVTYIGNTSLDYQNCKNIDIHNDEDITPELAAEYLDDAFDNAFC